MIIHFNCCDSDLKSHLLADVETVVDYQPIEDSEKFSDMVDKFLDRNWNRDVEKAFKVTNYSISEEKEILLSVSDESEAVTEILFTGKAAEELLKLLKDEINNCVVKFTALASLAGTKDKIATKTTPPKDIILPDKKTKKAGG